MTDPNEYLRRADVEALLDGKIAALNETADLPIPKGREPADLARASQIRQARARVGALSTVRMQLGMCERFRYRSFGKQGTGERFNSLVTVERDRVPLDPVEPAAATQAAERVAPKAA